MSRKDQIGVMDDHNFLLKYGKKEDPYFSPERNKAVIEGTIRAYEAKRAIARKAYGEQIGERANAVAMFLKHVNNGKGNNVVNYFGRRELARLRGEEIATQLRGRVSAIHNGTKQ